VALSRSLPSQPQKSVRYSLIAVLLIAMVSIAEDKNLGVIRTSTAACLGECPVYTFYLFADDTYIFDGREFTRSDRITSGTLVSGAFAGLIGLMEAKRFDDFEEHYGWGSREAMKACEMLSTDAPSTTILVHTAGLSKSVHVNWGCVGFFREGELRAIEQAITDLLIEEGLLAGRAENKTGDSEQ
jgi:Domain of unknown function (DUF6438)